MEMKLFRGLPVIHTTKDGWNFVTEKVAYSETVSGRIRWMRFYDSRSYHIVEIFQALKQECRTLRLPNPYMVKDRSIILPDMGLNFLSQRQKLGWKNAVVEIRQFEATLSLMFSWILVLEPDIENIHVGKKGKVSTPNLDKLFETRDAFKGKSTYMHYCRYNLQQSWLQFRQRYGEQIDQVEISLRGGKIQHIVPPDEIWGELDD